MKSILNYIINMMPYMIIIIPLFIIIRFIYIKIKNKKINLYHEVIFLIFIMFIVGLFSQTIIPKLKFGINGIEIVKNGTGVINFIPFKVIYDTYIEVVKHNNINYFTINFLGNIIMFIPIGFLIPVLWKINSKYVIIIGFSMSFFIEFCQLFLGRHTDIDDLILNTIGTILGLLVFKLLAKRYEILQNIYNSDCKK